jgi:hypothetical protein
MLAQLPECEKRSGGFEGVLVKPFYWMSRAWIKVGKMPAEEVLRTKDEAIHKFYRWDHFNSGLFFDRRHWGF